MQDGRLPLFLSPASSLPQIVRDLAAGGRPPRRAARGQGPRTIDRGATTANDAISRPAGETPACRRCRTCSRGGPAAAALRALAGSAFSQRGTPPGGGFPPAPT